MRHIASIAACSLAAVLALAPVAHSQSPAPQSPVRAGTYVIDPAHSKITWSVSHFGFSTYVGQFTGVAATLKLDPKALDATDLQVTVDTASVGTLNPALDTHLKSPDFLDAAKFPQATFKATSVKPTGEKSADITGDLTLHGVTKPVVIHATFNQAGVNFIDHKYSLGFAGTTVLKRSEFGIKTYSPAIGEDVTLQIEAEFKAAS
ncbi:YceI family protein [Phenylobacterium sp. LjRoot225]|uniref:YceI family protein n=1 Tax=Phenylobacterium sp. LjRoot225 TaxID=3342285 RepID=UPI003ECF626C